MLLFDKPYRQVVTWAIQANLPGLTMLDGQFFILVQNVFLYSDELVAPSWPCKTFVFLLTQLYCGIIPLELHHLSSSTAELELEKKETVEYNTHLSASDL